MRWMRRTEAAPGGVATEGLLAPGDVATEGRVGGPGRVDEGLVAVAQGGGGVECRLRQRGASLEGNGCED